MIHVENDNTRLEGSPLKLLAEAAMAFASAANGFFEVSKEIEDTEESKESDGKYVECSICWDTRGSI